MKSVEDEWKVVRSCISDAEAMDGRRCFLAGMLSGIALMAAEQTGSAKLSAIVKATEDITAALENRISASG